MSASPPAADAPPGHGPDEAWVAVALAQCASCERVTVVEAAEAGREPPSLEPLLAALRAAGRTVLAVPPGTSGRSLLRRLLDCVGLGDIDGDDLDAGNILAVYLRNEYARGRAPVLLLEAAQRHSGRELAALLPLLRLRLGGASVLKCVISGPRSVIDALECGEFVHRCGEPLRPAARPAAVAARPAMLRLMRGRRPYLERELDQRRLLIGRDRFADLVLPDRWISRYHALLIADHDGWWLIDLASVNGTRVNGARVARIRLSSADEVRLGQFRLRLDMATAAGAEDPLGATLDMPRLVGAG